MIGLTILAYRYEGLRPSDFATLLANLKQEMISQLGPYKKRPASEQWRTWVGAAGGHVRGHVGPPSDASTDASCAVDRGLEVPPLHLIELHDREQVGPHS